MTDDPQPAGTDARRGFSLPENLRSLRHRNFRLFLSGQLVSTAGTWMQSVAQSWLVYRLTGDSAMLGLVGFVGQIPSLLFAPLGGSLADTRNRHKIVVVTQAASMVLAFILAGLTLSGYIHIWHVFVLSGLLGLTNAFEIPARQAFLYEMVGRDDLMNAIALNSSMFNGARVVGPALAGIVIAAVGEGWCFFINGTSFLAVLAGLLLMRLEPWKPGPPSGRSALGHMAEGFHFVATTAPVRALLLLLGLVSLTGLPFSVLMPIFADQILHGGPKALGMLMGASGFGALLGALVLTSRKGVIGLGRWVMLGAGGFGLTLIAFSTSRSYWLSVGLLIPAGFTVMVQFGATNTLIQSMIPDRLRGRVMAIYAMMIMGMSPFGALFAGYMAKWIGPPGTVVLGGTACVCGALVFGLRLGSLRTEGRALIADQER